MGLNLTVFGYQVTVFDVVIFILIFGIIFVTIATIKFSRSK
jgi:ABC-2 type transport system permease protein